MAEYSAVILALVVLIPALVARAGTASGMPGVVVICLAVLVGGHGFARQQRSHAGADRAAADVVRVGRLARGRQADDEHAVARCACQAFAQRLRIPLGRCWG